MGAARGWRILATWLMAGAFVVAILAFSTLPVPQDAWPPMLLVAPITVVAVVVHELGHVLAALAVGARVLGVGVWPLWFARRRRGLRVHWGISVRGTAGLAFAIPDFRRDVRRQMIAFAAGGPSANVAAALPAFAWWLAGPAASTVSVAAFAFAVLSLAIGVVNLLPFTTPHFSDGATILAWRRNGAELDSSRRVLALYDASLRGVLASEIPGEDIAALESDEAVGVRFFGRYAALRAAQQRGDEAEFAAVLQRCRKDLDGIDPVVYVGLRPLWTAFLFEEAFERACTGQVSRIDGEAGMLRRIARATRLRLDVANALAGRELDAFERLLRRARKEAEGEYDAAARRAESALHRRLHDLRAAVSGGAAKEREGA